MELIGSTPHVSSLHLVTPRKEQKESLTESILGYLSVLGEQEEWVHFDTELNFLYLLHFSVHFDFWICQACFCMSFLLGAEEQCLLRIVFVLFSCFHSPDLSISTCF